MKIITSLVFLPFILFFFFKTWFNISSVIGCFIICTSDSSNYLFPFISHNRYWSSHIPTERHLQPVSKSLSFKFITQRFTIVVNVIQSLLLFHSNCFEFSAESSDECHEGVSLVTLTMSSRNSTLPN